MARSRQEELNKILHLASMSSDSVYEFYKKDRHFSWSSLSKRDQELLSTFEDFLRGDMLDIFVNRLEHPSDSKRLIKQALNSFFKTGKWNEIFARCFIEFISRHPQLIDQEDRDKFIV